jgi:hypothetical protein
VLSDPFSEGPGDRDMVLVRLSALVDSETRRADWPADDFAGWLDNLPDGVATSDRESRSSVASTQLASISDRAVTRRLASDSARPEARRIS